MTYTQFQTTLIVEKCWKIEKDFLRSVCCIVRVTCCKKYIHFEYFKKFDSLCICHVVYSSENEF